MSIEPDTIETITPEAQNWLSHHNTSVEAISKLSSSAQYRRKRSQAIELGFRIIDHLTAKTYRYLSQSHPLLIKPKPGESLFFVPSADWKCFIISRLPSIGCSVNVGELITKMMNRDSQAVAKDDFLFFDPEFVQLFQPIVHAANVNTARITNMIPHPWLPATTKDLVKAIDPAKAIDNFLLEVSKMGWLRAAGERRYTVNYDINPESNQLIAVKL